MEATVNKHDLQTRLIEKAWKDPEFRKKVVADPKGMFEEFLGRPLPQNLKIVVHEDDDKTLHLAIPPAPQNATELSDDELEKVAGGTEIIGVIISIATVVVTGVGSAVGLNYATAAAQGKSSPW